MLGIGVVVWLASELMFFAGLFAAWFGVRAVNTVWPPEGVELDVPRTALATGVLVASSFTLHAGERAVHAGDHARAARWVLLTAALGTAFVANQALEWAELPSRCRATPTGRCSTCSPASTGSTSSAASRSCSSSSGGHRPDEGPLRESLAVTAYYWHFVDVVWLAMFATVYLLG
jgi:cytochrome c oxidase subunit 3